MLSQRFFAKKGELLEEYASKMKYNGTVIQGKAGITVLFLKEE